MQNNFGITEVGKETERKVNLELIKSQLENLTDSKATVQVNTIKAHTKEINGASLFYLHTLYLRDEVKDLNIKRSGTGITIIVEVIE